MQTVIFKKVSFVFELCGIYIIWIFLHYISAHLYIYLCNRLSIIGFITSPFLVPALHCQALRWVVANGAMNINTMWKTIGMWLVTKLIIK